MNAKVLGITALLIMLCLFMAVMTSSFVQPNNIENLLRRTAMYGILGIGVAFVIVTSGIDLSIGSTVCLCGCLLAIFLQVDYRPADQLAVREVRASQQEIVVEGDARGYQPGTTLRYFGSRRVNTGLFQVTAVEAAGGQTRLKLATRPSRDGQDGQVAQVHPILEVDRGNPRAQPAQPASITLAASVGSLAPRDRITLVHPTAGLQELTIRDLEKSGERITVRFTNDLGGNVDTSWFAIGQSRQQRMSIPVALLAVLGIACGLGLLHGLLVTQMRLQPFVVTLCGLLIYRGISRWLVNDQPVGFGNEFLNTLSPLGRGKFVLWQWEEAGRVESFGIPYPFFILLLVAVGAAILLNKTIWGRYLLALGRNEEAARYSGILTGRITLLAYVLSTTLAAVGGILFALDSNQVPPSSFGNFFELYAIAAAVLGGCSLRGGEGSIFGVVVGTAVMQVLNNMIVLLRISDELEYAIIGAVILLGVLTDELVKRWASIRRGSKRRV